MRQVIYILLALSFSSVALASVNVQRRIAIFTQQSNAFRQVCFQGDGTYQDGLVVYDPSTSVRNTAIDCNAQAIALNQERDAIEREIQSLGGADCSLEVQDTSLVDLLNGGTGIVDEMNCPGIGSAAQCATTIGCNLGLSVLSAIPAIGPIISRGAGNALRQQPALRDCGAGGTNCFENIGASIGHVLYDTVTGICWLVTFGNYCTGEEEQTADPDGATRTRALAASSQNDQEVASFTSDPVGWVMNGVNSIISMVADAISRRYGCRQWSGAPFVSECVLPMEWDCANCDQKLNMICGTLGYIGSEIIATVFTGGAVGGVHALTTSLRGVRAVSAVEDYVVATRAARAVGRIGSAGARGLGSVWNGIANSRTVNALTSVASRVNTATRSVRIFAAGQDAVISAAVKYNELTEAAFRLGYNATAGARNRMLDTLLRDMPKVEDIRAGLYSQQGIRTVEDYRRVATSRMSPADRSRMRVIVTKDRPPRAVIVDSRAVAVDSDIRFDFNPQQPRPAPVVAAVPPPAAVNTADEVAEVEAIVVTAPRIRRDPAPSGGIVVSSRTDNVSGAVRITDGGLPQRAPAAEIRPASNEIPRNGVVSDITSGRITVSSSEGEDLIRRLGGEHVSFQDREIYLDVIMGGPRKATYFDEAGRFDDAFRTRYRELERRLNQNPDELRGYRAQVDSLSRERVATGNQKTLDEIDDIRDNRLPIRDEAFECSNLSRLTPGAFPTDGGRCRKLKFDDDVNGRYCSCGGMSKTSFTWLVRCPTRSTDYHQLSTYVDELALPFDSAPEMCTRVDIPRGKECYIGPTSPTFAGFGGTTQILCENRAPRAPRGKDGNPPTPEQVAAYEAQLEDIRRFGIQFGEPAVRPVRWAPFSTFTEYQNIVERAARACTNVCNINELAEIQRDFERATSAIRARGNPAELQRLAVEQRNFDQYLRELREGRKTFPTSTELSPSTPAPVVVSPSSRFTSAIAEVSPVRVPEVSGGVTTRISPATTTSGSITVGTRTENIQRATEIASRRGNTLDVMVREVTSIPDTPQGLARRRAMIAEDFPQLNGQVLDALVNDVHLIGAESIRAGRNYTGIELLAKKRRMRELGISDADADALLRLGYTGSGSQRSGLGALDPEMVRLAQESNVESIERITSRLAGTRDEAQKLTLESQLITARRRQAVVYAIESDRTGNLQQIQGAINNFAGAGDVNSTEAMMRAALGRGITPQALRQGIQERISLLQGRRVAGRNTLLDSEILTLREALRRLDPTPPVPARTATVQNTPQPALQPQPALRPAPQPAPRPEVRQPAAIVVSDIPPRRAQDMANDFRLGRNGRSQDLNQAAELYYRAADGAVQREVRALRTTRETNFMRDRNFSEAFEQSMNADGALSIRMIDDIYAAGGQSAINAFLAENFERFNSWNKNPVVRGNVREMIAHLRSRYGNELYGPQSNYLNSWGRANYDDPISLTNPIREKVQTHVALTDEQSAFLDTLINTHGGRGMTDKQLSDLLDNQASFGGARVENSARPFRSSKITSFFPEGTTPDDVMAAYARGRMNEVGRSNGTIKFQGEVNGNRYTLYVCESNCDAEGIRVGRNEVTSISPDCGPDILALPRTAKAKELLKQPGALTRESFYTRMLCQ